MTLSRASLLSLLLVSATAVGMGQQAPTLTGDQAAFAESLVLRADRRIADSSHPLMAWLAQDRPVALDTAGPLSLVLELRTADPASTVAKALGRSMVLGGNLASLPFPISIDVRGVPDGDYEYLADVRDGATSLRRIVTPVKLVAGLHEKQAAFERRLSRVTGHESAKATVRYPFDLARVINAGKRVFGSGTGNPEFGLNQAGQPTHYDFAAGLAHSERVLVALERGTDPVWRAGGERVRHYYMPEADEILPYRVFVPSKWDGRSRLPLAFILHGNSRDQDFYLERDGRIIPRTAERHGFMIVAPLGYSPNGGYNYVPYGRQSAGGRARGAAGAAATPQRFGPVDPAPAPATAGRGGGRGGPRGFGGVNGSVTPALVRSEWSELDTMHVFDLIRQEYPVDPNRTFLFGYSAGGQGSHYLGPKFSQHWAGIAIGGSNAMPADTYPYDKLKNIPVFIFVGDQDAPNLAPARAMAEALSAHGISATLKEYPGATHDSAPSAAIADIFAFFVAHPRK